MKSFVKISIISIALIVFFTACENNGVEKNKRLDVEGIYQGTLTNLNDINGNPVEISVEATSEITVINENVIQVHCYSEDFDTTLNLNYYENHDSAYVCYTGDDFEKMYGHMLGDGHMGGMGDMMDDMHEGETEWMHHMNEEHDENDEHFGGFDMSNHSFNYIFQMNWNDSTDNKHFQGIKQ